MPSFKTLTSSHLEECIAILTDLENHYEHPIGGSWTKLKLMEELRDHYGLGAFDDEGRLTAYCLYRKAPGTREIMLLATRFQTHRSGAMRSLIRSLIEDLSENEQLWLEVHAGNLPAIALYESLGFKLTGERKGYYSDGGAALLFEYKPLQ
ncbi:MAG: GNAT family N-acetyltransferase [Bdellovibrionales bacterium]|nr:GNAT family N-acetyltransferase [Bdellovibrionales bacterium]